MDFGGGAWFSFAAESWILTSKESLKTAFMEFYGDIFVRLPILINQTNQSVFVISPTHKRTEGRAPVWGSEFTSKRRRTTGGNPAETAVG